MVRARGFSRQAVESFCRHTLIWPPPLLFETNCDHRRMRVIE